MNEANGAGVRESNYQQAKRRWASFWGNIPGSTTWHSPWLNTTFADGTPMLDGAGILSAKDPEAGRAFQIIQEEDDAVTGKIAWWKQVWDSPPHIERKRLGEPGASR